MTMATRRTARHHLGSYCTAALLALGAGNAVASSFALIEQSVSGMGTAYAVGSSGLNDASTLYFNPATMSRLHGTNLSGGLQIVDLNTDFKGNGSYRGDIPLIGGSTFAEGKRKLSIDATEAVPSGYISHQYSDKVWFGFGINSPFGLKTEYSDHWVGRYHTIKSELLTINFNPTMAFKVNDNVSLGFGISAIYADGELTNALDGGLGAFAAGTPIPGWAPGSKTYDGKVKLTGDDWGYGFNTGVLLQPTQNARIGLHYRSEIDLTLDGDAKVTGFPDPLKANNGKQDAKLDVTLPDSVSLSGHYTLNTRWAVMADVTWTQWSDIETLDTKLQDGSRSVAVWDYDDSFRYSIGAEFKPNRTWTFRTGVALDETPVPNDNLRSPRVPDNERTWLTLGMTYRHTPHLTFDLGYAHIFVDDPKLKNVSDNHNPKAGQTTGSHMLTGEYDASVDIIGAQVNWRFK
jgi:long-chain fatty acid transport protein